MNFIKMRPFIYCLFIIIAAIKADAQTFSGNFRGQQPGIASTASLVVAGNTVKGSFTLNDRPGNVAATFTGNNCVGTLYDIQMQQYYAFTGSISRDSLYLSIQFPELNNQLVNLAMARLPATGTGKAIGSAGLKNPALIGLWRYTETFSSGSGDHYASFSTDYFMEFKSDGTVYSWTGKSAGGTADLGIQGYPSSTQKAGWYTEDKTLFLMDPVTGEKSSLLFYAADNRLLLHNGGKEKKVMVRIR